MAGPWRNRPARLEHERPVDIVEQIERREVDRRMRVLQVTIRLGVVIFDAGGHVEQMPNGHGEPARRDVPHTALYDGRASERYPPLPISSYCRQVLSTAHLARHYSTYSLYAQPSRAASSDHREVHHRLLGRQAALDALARLAAHVP